MHREYEVITRLEELYNNRSIALTFIILDNDCNVDVKQLEKLLLVRNFPLKQKLFIMDNESFRNHANHNAEAPTCVVIVKGRELKSSLVADTISYIDDLQGCIIMVV